MATDPKSTLDDDLLRELGLEPSMPPTPPLEQPRPAPKPAAPQAKGPMMPPGAAAPKPAARPPVAGAVPPPQRKAPPPVERDDPIEPLPFDKSLKDLAQDMPLQVVAVLGKRSMTLADLVALKQGEVIELKKLPNEAIDLVANGKLIARGELVLIDGKIGVQIKQII